MSTALGLSRWPRILVAALVASLAFSAAAEPHEPFSQAAINAAKADFARALAAHDRGDYGAAFDIWLPLARRGDPAAQRNIGHLHRMGLGVPQDFTEAANWYRRAADSGLARAQANLATMYLRGQGVAEDAGQAAHWFAAAAAQGHVLAQFNLGLLYLRGSGVERSEAKALGWFYLAAKAGHERSQAALGRLVPVLSGPMGPPPPPPDRPPPTAIAVAATSPVKAETAQAPAEAETAQAPAEAETVQAPAEVAKAEEWLPVDDDRRLVPAEGSSAIADAIVALFTSAPDSDGTGDDGEKTTADHELAAGLIALHAANFSVARDRWRPLAENGHAEAQFQLGKLFANQEFAEANRPEAFFWLSRAAAQNHDTARLARDELDDAMSREERLQARRRLQAGNIPALAAP
ncbi:MAG: hypothetical protein QF582_16085 [Alphaproteobacteria bacterium]|nr:hypothetical protein [Alphaproteobacteria bacterium]